MGKKWWYFDAPSLDKIFLTSEALHRNIYMSVCKYVHLQISIFKWRNLLKWAEIMIKK